MVDLTPTHTELQALRTYTPMAAVDTLLEASFTAYEYRICPACGRMDDGRGRCAPCRSDNAPPIYGASLAGHTPAPGAALRAVEAVWLTPASAPCGQCALVAAENSDLARQVVSLKGTNSDLAHQIGALRNQGILAPEGWEQRAADLLAQNAALCSQIVALKAHEIELCAQVRQGKLGAEG